MEHHAVVLDDEGRVLNVIVVPENDEDLGPAWENVKRQRVMPEHLRQGVGPGFRFRNGGFEDERPGRERPTPPTPPRP